jgi:hypothetical protein
VDSLETYEFLLAQRQREWLAERGAAVCRYGGLLGFRELAIGPHAPQEVALDRT